MKRRRVFKHAKFIIRTLHITRVQPRLSLDRLNRLR